MSKNKYNIGQEVVEVGWTEDGKLLCFDLDEFKKY